MTGKDQPCQVDDSASKLPPPGTEVDRIEAIALLTGQGDQSSAAQLTEMLADPRWRVRRAAAVGRGARASGSAMRDPEAVHRSRGAA